MDFVGSWSWVLKGQITFLNGPYWREVYPIKRHFLIKQGFALSAQISARHYLPGIGDGIASVAG